MSDTSRPSLDLGRPSTAPTDAEQPATQSAPLVLTPPAPVAVVPREQAGEMLPIDPSRTAELTARAAEFVARITALDPRDPAFTGVVRDVETMGDDDIRASAQVASRLLDRPAAALEASRGGGEGQAAQRLVADGLVDLRGVLEELDPSQVDSVVDGVLGRLPFGDRLKRYLSRYESAQVQLDHVIGALLRGQDELRQDNAALEQEKVRLWENMQRVQEYAVLAQALDDELVQHVETLRSADPDRAERVTADLLFVVRQKHQDLLTQLAVSAQGYLALDLVRRNNTELVRGVERATTTTVAALRTAVVVSQALTHQRLVLDQVQALSSTTEGLIASTSQMLRQQTTEVHRQATEPTVGVETLRRAFDDVYATMDTIDRFRGEAVEAMASTVSALEVEVGRAGAYLERTRTLSAAPEER